MFASRFFMTLAGLPATTVHGGTSLVTTAAAATTAPSPTVTPGRTIAREQIHSESPTTRGFVWSSNDGLVMSWDAVQRKAPSLTTAFAPIVMSSTEYSEAPPAIQLLSPTARHYGCQTRAPPWMRVPRPIFAPNARSRKRRHPFRHQRGVGRNRTAHTTSHASRRNLLPPLWRLE